MSSHPHAKNVSLAFALAACAMFAALGAGCAVQSAGTPAQIVRKAIDAQGNLTSVKLEVDQDADLWLPGGNKSTTVTTKGVYEKPASWNLTIRAAGGKTQAIIIGKNTWLLTPGADAWTAKNSQVPLTGSPPNDVVASKYLSSAKGVKMVDQNDGTYHLKFDLDLLTFAKTFNQTGIDPTLFKGKQAHVDVWIRKKDYFVQKATMNFASRLETPVTGTLRMSTEIDFSDFNKPVSIEPPI